MATDVDTFTIAFPDWYDDRAECEHAAKGFLPDVVVRLSGGPSYKLYFSDPVRLQQDLDESTKHGRPFYAEPGLVVIPEVTPEAIREAVAGLWKETFFQHLQPLAARDAGSYPDAS
ncbi:MAG TPA: hypothetical protein VKA46_40060 [Gemmataceae bacterium]|nr:hypothetical protein [Gemmataceae bacterium]